MSTRPESQQPASGNPQTQQGASSSTPPKRKARWGRRLLLLGLFMLVGLVGLIAAAPWIASQPQARGTILGYVNDAIPGQLNCDDFSLSWFRPIQINGLQIKDDQQRDVMQARSISLGSGLAGIARAPSRFAELKIEDPDIALHMDDGDQPSLVRAFVKPNPKAEAALKKAADEANVEPQKLPEIVGRVVLNNGRVRVFPKEGKEHAIKDINVDVDLQSLNAIKGTLGFVMDGGAISAQANVDNLAPNGKLNTCEASGKLTVNTEGELDLGALLALVMPAQPMSGKAALNIDADFRPDGSNGKIIAQVRGLQMPERGGTPLDLDLNSDIDLKGTLLAAKLNLSGTPGAAQVALDADTNQAMPELNGEQILGAILGGKSIALPEFSLDATSTIDVARIEAALPGILQFGDDVALASGTVELSKVEIRGGKSPSVAANAKVSNAALRSGTQTNTLAPMNLALAANLPDGSGVKLDQLDLATGFATVKASGDPDALQCNVDGDLAQVQRELARFMDMGAAQLSGRLTADINLQRQSDERFTVSTTVNATQARVVTGDTTLNLNQGLVEQGGALTMKDGVPSSYRAENIYVDLDKQVVLSGKGGYGFEQKSFDADLNLEKGDLGFVAQRAGALGMPELARFAGQVTGQLTIAGDASPALSTSGNLNAVGLMTDGKPIVQNQLAVNWKDVAYQDGGKRLRAALAKIESTEMRADIANADIDLASGNSASGKVNINADLAAVFATVGRLGNMVKPPAIAGRLTINGDIAKAGGALQFAANGAIEQMVVGEGQAAVREPRVGLKLDAKVDPAKSTLMLGQNELTSGLLSAKLSGSLRDYSGALDADLTGEYSTEWAAITKLIQELSPSTAKLVSIQGGSRSQISLKGPLNRPSDNPPFKAADAAFAVGWDAADIMGVDLSKAKIDVKLNQGELAVQSTRIAAAQGAINLNARYNLEQSLLRMPGKTAVLDGVVLTPELARELLSRINPIFYHVVSAEGNVDLGVNDLELPLATPPQGGKGGGKLMLKNAKIEPGGVLGELVQMGVAMQTGQKITVRLEGADFEVRDGRIHYRDFALIFPPDFDLRFKGSVGLNDSLDLIVSIPICPELLARLGIKGPVVEYARMLAGTRIDVPMVGTRENPKLDFSKVDTNGLMKDIVKGGAGQSARDLIQGAIPGIGGKGDSASKGSDGKDSGRSKRGRSGRDKKGDGKKDEGKKKKKKGITDIIPGIGG